MKSTGTIGDAELQEALSADEGVFLVSLKTGEEPDIYRFTASRKATVH